LSVAKVEVGSDQSLDQSVLGDWHILGDGSGRRFEDFRAKKVKFAPFSLLRLFDPFCVVADREHGDGIPIGIAGRVVMQVDDVAAQIDVGILPERFALAPSRQT
jgi:hypothetical protein